MSALLAAIGLTIFVIEAQIPPLIPAPGVKLGLSNIVTLFALYTVGPWNALSILLIRIFLGSIFTGQMMALIYSLAGGLFCFFISVLLYRFFSPRQIWIVSVLGAIAHNMGQMAAAIWITGTVELLLYLPVLIIFGILAGLFTGISCKILAQRLNELKLISYCGKWKAFDGK